MSGLLTQIQQGLHDAGEWVQNHLNEIQARADVTPEGQVDGEMGIIADGMTRAPYGVRECPEGSRCSATIDADPVNPQGSDRFIIGEREADGSTHTTTISRDGDCHSQVGGPARARMFQGFPGEPPSGLTWTDCRVTPEQFDNIQASILSSRAEYIRNRAAAPRIEAVATFTGAVAAFTTTSFSAALDFVGSFFGEK